MVEGALKFNLWRAFMGALALSHACIFALLVRGTWTGSLMQVCAFVYLFQICWRCVFLSEYVHRYTISRHPCNAPLVGRLLAFAGELGFGVQLVLFLTQFQHGLCSTRVLPGLLPDSLPRLEVFIIPLDFCGQLLATWGTICQKSWPFFFEGCLWTAICSVLVACLLNGWLALDSATPLRALLSSAIGVASGTAAYMIGGYVPMCWRAWREQAWHARLMREKGIVKPKKKTAEKWYLAFADMHPTTSWEHWRPEVVWQTLYFAGGAWASLLILRVVPE